ncbi:collagen binding domain-containing protein [Streptomyces sp. NPDC088817]|uniref:MSCRAMM family protein n=1 Tax=unclassified Streptomyces TaxID=2593676 RepID=UPI0036E0C02F
MHARIVRSAVRSTAIAAAVTGTLTSAPTASALPDEPTPSTFSAPTESPEPEAGSVAITKKDPAGDVLRGATFLLLDAMGQEAGLGKTDTHGKLTFTGLAPGIYRLKETASGSPLHEVVADQDVIVTPGATAQVTVVDPFKPVQVTLKAKDDKTGKLLPGATVNIGSSDKTLLTLTTGAEGTATAKLPVTSRIGTDFWVRQIKAPTGYDLYKGQINFKAKPGDPVTVTLTNAKTHTTPPSSDPSDKPTTKPTHEPADKPTTGEPGDDSSSAPSKTPCHTPTTDKTASSTSAPVPNGSLAHTGADATPWLLGGAGLLLVAGGGAVVAVRRRRTDDSDDHCSDEG